MRKSRLFIVLLLNGSVYFVALYIDGTERAGGTEVLAGTAADTPLGIDRRHGVCTAVDMYHSDRPRRAMAGTVAALDTVGKRHTVLAHPYGMPYLRGGLVLACDGTDSACGAYLAATGALGAAVAALVGHHGLHQRKDILRGTQHVIGAGGNA